MDLKSPIVLSLGLLACQVSAKCYYPNGTIAQDTPCTDATTESTCCGTGYACVGLISSFFLCNSTGDQLQTQNTTQFVRGSCTDKSWRSGNCPNVCVQDGRDNTGGGNGVGQCPGSSDLFYCIGGGLGVENCSSSYNLIDFGSQPTILTTIGILASTSTSTTAQLTASSASPVNSTPASSTTAMANNSSGLSTGATAGLAVGVTVGVLGLLVGAVAIFFLMRHGRARSGEQAEKQAPGTLLAEFPQSHAPSTDEVTYPYQQQSTLHEAPDSTSPPIHELADRDSHHSPGWSFLA